MGPIQTRYARTSDGVYLGYQVAGDGPLDFVWQPDWPGNIDMEWDFRVVRGYLDAFSSFSRLIRHDHRGVGLSSRNVAIPNLETRVADLLTVLDAVGAMRPTLVGWASSASVNALLASTRPERVNAMVWMDAAPRTRRAPGYPWGRTSEELDAELADLRLWGTEEYSRVSSSRNKRRQAPSSPTRTRERLRRRAGTRAHPTSRSSSRRCGRRPTFETCSPRSASPRCSSPSPARATESRPGTRRPGCPVRSTSRSKGFRSAPR